MGEPNKTSTAARYLVLAAAFVIVVAGLRAAEPIVVPVILAAFIAVICAPASNWLQKWGFPLPIAVFIVIAAISLAVLLPVAVAGTSLERFLANQQKYTQDLDTRKDRIKDRIDDWLGKNEGDPSELPDLPSFDVGTGMKLMLNLLGGLYGLFSNVFLILLILVFVLLEASGFPAKLCAISHVPETSLAQMESILDDIRRYLSIKTAIGLVTGAAAALLLTLLRVDYPLLWGLLAFLLNYIPNIGSIIAAIPPVALAWIQLGNWPAVYTVLGYVVINVVIGQVVEPRVLGRRLGLSALVILLSLLFWGWVWGPVGMLLSVPLTMIVKIALENSNETRWIAVLLGPEVGRDEAVTPPPETPPAQNPA